MKSITWKENCWRDLNLQDYRPNLDLIHSRMSADTNIFNQRLCLWLQDKTWTPITFACGLPKLILHCCINRQITFYCERKLYLYLKFSFFEIKSFTNLLPHCFRNVILEIQNDWPIISCTIYSWMISPWSLWGSVATGTTQFSQVAVQFFLFDDQCKY